MKPSRPYSDPYLAGFGLGLVLLASFVVAGHGLGVSGGFSSAAAGVIDAAAPARAAATPAVTRHLTGAGPWRDWLLFEVAGMAAGGLFSALLAGRFATTIERGPRTTAKVRLACAFGGGIVMGSAAVLARGCTSGLALTGGALLSVGGWIFIAAVFTAAYLLSPFTRKAWK